MKIQFFYSLISPILFFLGIICIFLTFSSILKKKSIYQKNKWHAYFEDEQIINFSRKKEIPPTILLTIEIDKIPTSQDNECKILWTKLKRFTGCLMCSLENFSNSDLKKQFGYQNFQNLIEYETTYLSFMDELITYALTLKEKNYLQEATQTLEYAVELCCDKRTCYLTLIELYVIMKNKVKLLALKEMIRVQLTHSVYYQTILQVVERELVDLNHSMGCN